MFQRSIMFVANQVRGYMQKHRGVFIAFIVLLLCAVFLRLYRLPEFATFLGDQGRDAITIKRLLTLENIPAVGAPSSVGNVFLGPFYYFFMAPFLLLFLFNPVGLAYGVAFLSLVGLVLSFLIVQKEENRWVGLIFFFFAVFSASLIEFSRFSWNPNLLPIFAFFTLYFFYKVLNEQTWIYALLFGSFFAFSTQLHHLGYVLALPCLVMGVYSLVKAQPKERKHLLILAGWSIGIFFFFSSTLILFDLKNNFVNTKSFFQYLQQGDPDVPTDMSYVQRFSQSVRSMFVHVWMVGDHNGLGYAFLLLTVGGGMAYALYKKDKKRPFHMLLFLHALYILLFLLFFALLDSFRHPHYYTGVYLSIFYIWAVLLYALSQVMQRTRYVYYSFLCVIAIIFLFFNTTSTSYGFLWQQGSNQIVHARNVAESIYPEITEEQYQMIALPPWEMHGHYRYFLEVMGKTPLPEESPDPGEQIIVVCPDPHAECKPIGDPQWQLAAFDSPKVEKVWTVERVKIYKIVHKKDL